MEQFSDDVVTNAILQGIKRDIDIAINNQCWRAAVILIYSAMDTMAFISMPAGQDDVNRRDFVNWVDHYVRLRNGSPVRGIEFYGARCAMLHTYGTISKLSRAGEVRQIGYVDNDAFDARFNPTVAEDLVMVSIVGLRHCLFAGIDKFLIDVFADSERAPIAEARLAKLVNAMPRFADDDDSSAAN